jgi:hypothetical protein
MSTDQHSLEVRIEHLEEIVQQLSKQVAELEQKAPNAAIANQPQPSKPNPSPAADTKPPDESQLLSGSSYLLQYISILCFLLVAALGLRAMTDNGIINQQIGTILGLGYAAALIIASHLFYRKENILAPLFAVTGALLMFTVLVETYSRFEAIPMVAVYTMLAATGIGLALISYANHAALPIIIGTLGMCVAGVVIDYPTPYFPFLGLLLWTANILGFFATRLKRCSWLRWFLLFITHFMLQIWGLKVSGKFFQQAANKDLLAPDWFIPIVTLIGLTFMMISLFGIIRSGEEKISKFDFSLPAVNAGWCYVAGIYAMKNPLAFGTPAAAAAIAHFGIAYWLSTRQKRNAPGTNTFIAGGTILVCLSLPAILNSLLAPLPILAGLALTIAYLSRQWLSGGMRVTATLLQVYICLLLGIEFLSNGITTGPAVTILATGLCGILAFLHYRFCRRHKPSPQSQFFAKVDKNDVSTIFVLLASLTNLYYAGITLSQALLKNLYAGDQTTAFIASQSLIINTAAILLVVIATFYRNNELRNVSTLITIIGGVKVFLIDMVQISGAWLVASIFAFGIAAALESFVLARWQPDKEPKSKQPEAEASPEALVSEQDNPQAS